jgi:hypothetical protein
MPYNLAQAFPNLDMTHFEEVINLFFDAVQLIPLSAQIELSPDAQNYLAMCNKGRVRSRLTATQMAELIYILKHGSSIQIVEPYTALDHGAYALCILAAEDGDILQCMC